MLYKLFAKFIVKFQEITVDLELLQLLYACLFFFYSLNIVIAVSVVYSRFNSDNAIGFSHTLISWERPKRAKLDMLLLREIQEHSKTNYTVLDKLTNASLIKSLKCNLIFFFSSNYQFVRTNESNMPSVSVCWIQPTSNSIWQKFSPSVSAFMCHFH